MECSFTMALEDVLELKQQLQLRAPWIADHTQRVADFTDVYLDALLFREYPGLNQSYADKIKFAAHMHDIGKSLMSPDLLNAKEFSAKQRKSMRFHPISGFNMLLDIDFDVALMIRQHHENYWGKKGYPDGVQGDDISLGGRVLRIVDSFDAICSVRPYNSSPLSYVSTLDHLRESPHYDSSLLAIFRKLFYTGACVIDNPKKPAANIFFLPQSPVYSQN